MRVQAGDDLVELIRTRSADDDVVGPAANDLLSEFFAGYPVENLGRLLHGGDDKTVRTGTWLLSELGDLAAPLMGEIPALLAHPLRQVRFFAIDVVLANGGEHDGPLIAQALALTRDPDSAVRWKALGFLADASPEQLATGAESLPDGRLKELTGWLARLETEEVDPRGIVAMLEGDDQVTRLFATAAAARLSGAQDTNLLAHAATVEEEEIRSFALERIDELR